MSIRVLSELVTRETAKSDARPGGRRREKSPAPAPGGPPTGPPPAVEVDKTLPPPTLTELLTQTLSAPILAAYTAAIAAITLLVVPTSSNPDPDPLVWARWACFGIFVVVSCGYAWLTVQPKVVEKGKSMKVTYLAVTAVLLTSVAWGIGMPESALLTGASKGEGAAWLVIAGFLGAGLNMLVVKALGQEVEK